MTDDAPLGADELAGWLRARLPVRAGRLALATVDEGEGPGVTEGKGGDLVGVVRLLVYYEADGGELADVKEQQLTLVPAHRRAAPARVRAFVEAWADVMPAALERFEPMAETVMPYDLVTFDPLRSPRFKTYYGFRRALERRFGLGPARRGEGPAAPVAPSGAGRLRPDELAAWLGERLPLRGGRLELAGGAPADAGLVVENEGATCARSSGSCGGRATGPAGPRSSPTSSSSRSFSCPPSVATSPGACGRSSRRGPS
jgi:hypothetical protein